MRQHLYRSALACLMASSWLSCNADWLAPINPSTAACDVSDPWSCPAPLTCIDGLCLRSDQPRCGDGIVQNETGEQCDDGNARADDRCDSCRVTFCGDNIVQAGAGEVCDDGNLQDTDSCTTRCEWARCGDGIQRLDAVAGSELYEACDDGNTDNRDRCSNACETAKCGDGWVLESAEHCDDGNTVDDDGCSNTCGLGIVDLALRELYGGCLVNERQDLRCWGRGTWGDHSTSPPGIAYQARAIEGLPKALQVVNDTNTACALTPDHSVWCWEDTVENLQQITSVPEGHRIAMLRPRIAFNRGARVLVYSPNSPIVTEYEVATKAERRLSLIHI